MSKRSERSDKGPTKDGGLYGYTSLMSFCEEKNIVLTSEHTHENTNRDTQVKGICIWCEAPFKKSFRAMMKVDKKNGVIKLSPYCVECVTYISVNNVKETCMIRYGKTNARQVPSVALAIEATNLIRYGFKSPLSNQEVRDKRDETDRKNHNGMLSVQTEEQKAKSRATGMINRGYEYPSQCPIVKAKCKKTYQEKYGHDYYILSPEFQERYKAKMIEKYGVEHPMHSQEIAKRCHKNSFKTKVYVSESGKEYNYQGYENFMIKHLIDTGISEDDIINESGEVPFIKWYDSENKPHFHIVDIYIPSKNKCIEVKSEWTILQQGESNVRAKQEWAKSQGLNYEIWIFNNKGHPLDVWY